MLRKRFHSKSLGIEKSYFIYLPPGYESSRKRYPVLYLFRGHEKEWFDPYQDHSRSGSAVQHLANELTASGRINEMIIVGAGLTSDDGSVYGLGVNFLSAKRRGQRAGIGSGKFEDYITADLIDHIDSTYRTRKGRKSRAADGFSLGGYTSVMLAIKHPDLFISVGSYDGSHMFYDLNDPRVGGAPHTDTLWMRPDAMFAAAFRPVGKKEYDPAALNRYNPLNILSGMNKSALREVRKTNFCITSAAFDGSQGNRDRAIHLMTLFQQFGIQNRAGSLILSKDAHHTWKFADLHLRQSLRLHSMAFGMDSNKINAQRTARFLADAEFLRQNDAGIQAQCADIRYRIYEEGTIRLELYNLHGERIKTLFEKYHECGRHRIDWNGENDHGQAVTSGTYFAQLITPQGAIRQKIVFLR